MAQGTLRSVSTWPSRRGALSAQIDLRQGRLHVNRAKGGCASVHPLHGSELRALRPLQGVARTSS
jgi:hypothetical protein